MPASASFLLSCRNPLCITDFLIRSVRVHLQGHGAGSLSPQGQSPYLSSGTARLQSGGRLSCPCQNICRRILPSGVSTGSGCSFDEQVVKDCTRAYTAAQIAERIVYLSRRPAQLHGYLRPEREKDPHLLVVHEIQHYMGNIACRK